MKFEKRLVTIDVKKYAEKIYFYATRESIYVLNRKLCRKTIL